MNTQKETLYYIDHVAISQEKFDRFLATLTEVEKTWYCEKTQYGGKTGYTVISTDNAYYDIVLETNGESGNKDSIVRST